PGGPFAREGPGRLRPTRAAVLAHRGAAHAGGAGPSRRRGRDAARRAGTAQRAPAAARLLQRGRAGAGAFTLRTPRRAAPAGLWPVPRDREQPGGWRSRAALRAGPG